MTGFRKILASALSPVVRFRADRAMQIPARADTEPKWCAMFPAGRWRHHTAGDMEVTPELARDFVASWKAAGSPPLPITINHVPDDMPVVERQQAAAAVGWIEDLRVGTGDVALEGYVRWNEKGKALIASDAFRFLSPEWSMQHIDRRSGSVGGPWLYGAALLNDPFFHTMPRVAANNADKTNAAAEAKEQFMLQRLIATLAVFGLTATATEDEIVAAVEKLKASKADADAKLTAAASSTAKLTALEQAVETLKASNIETTTKLGETSKLLVDAQAKATAVELDSAIEVAKRAGKAITPDLKASIQTLAKSCGLDEAKKLIASLPVSVKGLGKETGITAGVNAGGDSTEEARAEYHRLMAEHTAAGKTPTQALNLIKRHHPVVFASAMKAQRVAAPQAS